jgi:hypothetical protein
MCKLVIFTRAPFADNPKKQRKLFDDLLSALGKTEHDGLGMAWTDHQGMVHHRKWATSDDYRGILKEDMRSRFCLVGSTPVDDTPANGFAILHGRTATSEKGLINAHPHVADDGSTTFALIHNGVVSMSEAHKQELGSLVSKCDSELILAAFMKGGMEHVSKTVCGYYAFGVIVSSSKEERYLHVVKDDRANLYAGELEDGSFVFATTQDLLASAGAVKQGRMTSLVHLVFDCDGAMIEMFDIPKPATYVYTYSPAQQDRREYESTNVDPPKVLTEAEYEKIWERYRRRNGLEKENESPTHRVAVQEEMNELLDATIDELDKKIAKSKARTERLEFARDRRMKDIAAKNAEIIAQVASGTSDTHSHPNSEDEAQAIAASLIEAERQAAGVASPPDDEPEVLPGELNEGEIASPVI